MTKHGNKNNSSKFLAESKIWPEISGDYPLVFGGCIPLSNMGYTVSYTPSYICNMYIYIYIRNIPTSTCINLGLHGFYIDYKPLRIRGQWDAHALPKVKPWAPGPEPLLPAFLRQEALGCRQAGTGELMP